MNDPNTNTSSNTTVIDRSHPIAAPWLVAMIAVVALVGIPTAAAEPGYEEPEATRTVDRLLQESWDREQITPLPVSSDAEFCRRVWLDLAGVAPSIGNLREFLADTGDDKRGRLIDRLLRSTRHANHMATRWSQYLLPADAESVLQRQNAVALHRWLREQFMENVRYDSLVARILTAHGSSNQGPVIFYTSRELAPERIAAATSQVFMGIQLQCAQCHDHPFDHWTQEDFWQYAAFFSQLEQSDTRAGQETFVEDRPGRDLRMPESEEVLAPRYPGVKEPPEEDPQDHRRRQLTIWMASRDNPYLARSVVNRVWAHLFGRGLVDPCDAMNEMNPPSHPEILDFLSDYLIEQRFNLRALYATLARTRAYSLTSDSGNSIRPADDSFAAMPVKVLTSEQFFDSLEQNVYQRSGAMGSDAFSPLRARRSGFLTRMRASNDSPREYPHGVVQVLSIMNGPEVISATNPTELGLLESLKAPFMSDDERIEVLFLATLSRMPGDKESIRFAKHLAAAETSAEKQAALADLLWVLLNTSECAVCP